MGLFRRLHNEVRRRAPSALLRPTGPTQDLWTDRPDALEELERRHQAGRYSDGECEQLRRWIEDGGLLMDDPVPLNEIDELNDEIDRVWTSDRAKPGLKITGVWQGDGRGTKEVTHEELLASPLERRLAQRDFGLWRIGAFHEHAKSARAMMENRALIDFTAKIFDWESTPNYSICFYYGSEQALHQDAAVFHVAPDNYVIGAWIACEDITEDSGPLVYYPGSHREPLYEGFGNYPYNNLRTADDAHYAAYGQHVKDLAERYEPKRLLAKKGQIFLWHAMLIHGGSPRTNPTCTRRSFVVHYVAKGADRIGDVTAPARW